MDINYYGYNTRPYYRNGIKCVFISHKKEDYATARKNANYLLTAGINVYFDEYDNTFKS